MLYTHYSNRTESLGDVLAAVIRSRVGAATVFEPEVVVVNNAGMGRWLQLHVARVNGISANMDTCFPAELVWRLLRAVISNVPEHNRFEPRFLAWRLFGLFDEVTADPDYHALADYLGQGNDSRQWSVAGRLAQLYDQYLVYRPDWVGEWEAGRGTGWQARLWRHLIRMDGNRHWATLRGEFLSAIDRSDIDPGSFPACINVFGIPSLSPGYLEVLAAVSRHVDVHLYWFNPCRLFWADIFTAREAGRVADESPHVSLGNPLLANWGKQGRETLDLIQELDPQDFEYYQEPSGNSLLAGIQRDILDLEDHGSTNGDSTSAGDDDSIMIHSCHGPMREVEVLHDQLLAYFSRHDDLQPSDVLVMTPDIERYAPCIDAVFRAAPESLYIPFSIADQGPAAQAPVLSTFLKLFELPRSRLTTEYVFGLLEDRCVADRFDLSEDDVTLIRGWVADAGVRWGFDAAQRGAMGMPESSEHTWQLALDRLLLGYAMPTDDEFSGILPYVGVEMGAARALGRFHTFITRLSEYSERLARRMPVPEWSLVVARMSDDLLRVPAEQESAMQCLRKAMDDLAASSFQSIGDRPVSLDVVLEHLREAAQASVATAAFLGNGVTFCAMVPMRSIPFPLICMIGMDDGAFPRGAVARTLDLMSNDYRRGDRSRRDDDRYLFLETLLSARRGLYISYVGRDFRDDSERPPSVVVSDLLDYIGQGCADREPLVVQHPLQAFNARYFPGDHRLMGHQWQLASAAAALEGEPRPPRQFFERPIAVAESELPEVSLEHLVGFFSNPARYLLRARLGVWLDSRDETFDDREPFAIDFDSGELLRHAWLERYAEPGDVDACEHELRQRSLLPHGLPGRILLEREIRALEAWRPKVRELLDSTPREPADIDLSIGGTRVFGRIDGITEDGLLHLYLRKLQARDRIRMALHHLAAMAAGVLPDAPSHLVAMDSRYAFATSGFAAESLLEAWIDAWHAGQSRPLHFFPRAAFAYLDAGDPDKALRRAQSTWSGSDFSVGECRNAYYRKAFAGVEPVDHEFEAHVRQLLEPLRDIMVMQ